MSSVGDERLETAFEIVAEAVPHMTWVTGPSGSTVYMNRLAREYADLPPGGLDDWRWLEAIHPDDAERTREAWERATAERALYEIEYRVRGRDGEYRWMSGRAQPVRNAQGEVLAWTGTWTDIDARKREEEIQREADRRTAETLSLIEALQATTPVAFGFLDRDLRIQRVTPRMADLAGVQDLQDAIGRPLPEVAPEIWRRIEEDVRAVLEGAPPRDREVVRGPEGARHWQVSFFPVRSGDDEVLGVGIVGVDVTGQREADHLRSVIVNNMAEGLYALDSEGRVMFMNPAASKMLGWTEDELRGREMHPLVHFQAADGTPLPPEHCDVMNVRARRRVSRGQDAFTRRDGSIMPVSYSAAPLSVGEGAQGVVVTFRDISDDQAAHARAQRELDSLAWVGRIRDALDEDRLVLHGQRIVPLRGGAHSQELLLRMVGRTGEVVPPRSFLPVAERFGLIREVDRWVISHAIRLASEGRRVEANLSADSIASLDVLPFIEHAIHESGADPGHLVFELTETALMRDVQAGEAFAHGLAHLGVGLALDDFGTGFGSFTYLKRLPVGFLKIDTDFVRDLPTNSANQHLVQATVNIAQGFGQQTIAEGVEDEETLAMLRDYGVDFAQGFHLGRPIPIESDGHDPGRK